MALRSHRCKSRTWYKVSCYYWPQNFRMATRTFAKSVSKQLASSARMLLELLELHFGGTMEFDTWIYLISSYFCGAQTRHDNVLREIFICAGSKHEPWCGWPQSPCGNGGLSAPEVCHRCHISVYITGTGWSFSSHHVGSRFWWCLITILIPKFIQTYPKIIRPKPSRILQNHPI